MKKWIPAVRKKWAKYPSLTQSTEKPTPHKHHLDTHSKGQPPILVQSMIAGMGKNSGRELKNQAQSIPFCPGNTITESTNF